MQKRKIISHLAKNREDIVSLVQHRGKNLNFNKKIPSELFELFNQEVVEKIKGYIMMPIPPAHKIAKLTTKRLHQSMSYQKQTLNIFIKRLDNKIWLAKNYPKITKAIVSAIYLAYFHENSHVIREKNPTGSIICLDELKLPKGIIVNVLEERVELDELLAYDYVNILVEF